MPPGPGKGKFLGQASVNLVSDAVTHACGLLGGFFLAKFTTPALYGVIQGFKILYTFAPFASFGADSGTNAVLAMERGKHGDEQGNIVAGTGLRLYLVPQALLCLGLILWSLFVAEGTGWERWGYLASGVSVFVLAVKQILSVILVGREQIRDRAIAGMMHGLTGLAATIPAAYYLGVPAFWIADWASAWALLLLVRAVDLRSVAVFSWAKAKEIYSYGFVMFIGTQVATLFSQADRIVILGALGTEALGYYGVGSVATRGLLVLGTSITSPYSPRALRMLAAGEHEQVREQTDLLARAMGWFGAYLAVFGAGAITLLVLWLLPRYTSAIPVAAAFVVVLPVVCTGYTTGSIPVYYGWFTRNILVNAMLVVDAFALDLLAAQRGWGITGVAAMASLVQFMQSTIFLYLTWRMLGDSIPRCFRRLGGYMFPFAAVLLGVPACYAAVLAYAPGGLVRDVIAVCALFAAVTSPALYGLARDLELATRFEALLRARGWLGPAGRDR